ncbi:MAG: PmoA family protein [Phycisphaeraceae bacterium]
MRSIAVSLVVVLFVAATAGTAGAADGPVQVKTEGQRVTVLFGGKVFTEFHGEGQTKPILYPIIGPTGVNMVRNWPIKEAAEGEAKDHPHHTSLWYTHGAVNGIDFWAVGESKGKIVAVGKPEATVSPVSDRAGFAVVKSAHEWRGPDGKVVLTDDQTITFHLFINGDRAIDYEVTLKASHGDVVFGDTKEGSMGIRTNPALRLKGTVAKGQAVNSEGAEGTALWGKRAKWVDYWAPIEGSTVGVAIMDHPKNPRYPTHWHAREYGLIAANPFGINDFEKKGKGAGDMVIKKGEKVTFKYRFLFHKGDVKEGRIAEQFEAWAK